MIVRLLPGLDGSNDFQQEVFNLWVLCRCRERCRTSSLGLEQGRDINPNMMSFRQKKASCIPKNVLYLIMEADTRNIYFEATCQYECNVLVGKFFTSRSQLIPQKDSTQHLSSAPTADQATLSKQRAACKTCSLSKTLA